MVTLLRTNLVNIIVFPYKPGPGELGQVKVGASLSCTQVIAERPANVGFLRRIQFKYFCNFIYPIGYSAIFILENYYLTEHITSSEDFSKSLESMIPGSTIKSRAVLNKFSSTGDGIISKDFYIGNNLTKNLIEIEIQNSTACIFSIPRTGSYTTRVSNRSTFKFSIDSGGIVLPTDNLRYKAISDAVNDLIIIISLDNLLPILDKNYNIIRLTDSFIRLDTKSEKVATIRDFIVSTVQSVRNFPYVRESLLLKTNIKEITSLFVADLIADSLKISPVSANSPGILIVKKAEEYIEHECESIFTIQEIANKLNTTPRTLQISFKKHREYTPMQFLKERKLHKARKLLLKHKDFTISIKQAALSAGLLDLNRFSKYYYEMFGELPSTTIKKETNS